LPENRHSAPSLCPLRSTARHICRPSLTPVPNVRPVSAATGQVSFVPEAIKLRVRFLSASTIQGSTDQGTERFKGRSLKLVTGGSSTSSGNNRGKSACALARLRERTGRCLLLESAIRHKFAGELSARRIYGIVGFGSSAISLTGLWRWLEGGRRTKELPGRRQQLSARRTLREASHAGSTPAIDGVLVSRGVITSRGVDYTVSGQERASAQLGPPMMQGPPVPPPSGHILAF